MSFTRVKVTEVPPGTFTKPQPVTEFEDRVEVTVTELPAWMVVQKKPAANEPDDDEIVTIKITGP